MKGIVNTALLSALQPEQYNRYWLTPIFWSDRARAWYEVLQAVSRDAECGLFPIRISSLCFERKFSIFVARP